MNDEHQAVNHGQEESSSSPPRSAASELEEYRKFLYEWARRQVREEDWQAFSEDDYSIAAEDVIAELERQQES